MPPVCNRPDITNYRAKLHGTHICVPYKPAEKGEAFILTGYYKGFLTNYLNYSIPYFAPKCMFFR